MGIVSRLRKNLVNIPGWRTSRKIVVIESDDWGAITMPSKETYEYLLGKGIPVDRSRYTRYDVLEGNSDFTLLFEMLSKHRDFKGNHPCITLNTIVANPDFNRIQDSGLESYYFETFLESYKQYPFHNYMEELWKTGMEKKYIWPQFHGREHLNPQEWLKCVKSNELEKIGFESRSILALSKPLCSTRQSGYMSAFNYESEEEFSKFKDIIKEGTEIFESIFGFKSVSFVAPTSIRSDKLDPILNQYGIKYHQVGQQLLPDFEGKNKTKNRFWGNINAFGQIYWRRNGTFEPSRNQDLDWTDRVLSEMKIAFRWGKPFVLNSHRVNFMGGIDPDNRDKTLKHLDAILQRMLQEYPEIEFLSSDQLGFEISNK